MKQTEARKGNKKHADAWGTGGEPDLGETGNSELITGGTGKSESMTGGTGGSAVIYPLFKKLLRTL